MNVNQALRIVNPIYFALEASKDSQVIEILNRYFQNVKIDKKLGKRLYQYQIGYVNTSREYVEFFGSNLLGVNIIRFKDSDVLRFFNEVLEIDMVKLEEEIRLVDSIQHNFKISSDIFNLTVIYLVHRCLSEKSLDIRDRQRMAYNTALIFFYRAIAALLSAWFRYPATPQLAQAAYANLSYKFLIKKLGSWHNVMDYRANELIHSEGVQYQKLLKLLKDEDLVDVINDSANLIRDMVKNYFSELEKVRQQGERISVSQMTGYDVEGEEVVRDKIHHVDRSVAQIKHILADTHAWVRDDLITVISDINKNTSSRLIRDSLVWMSENVNKPDHNQIDEVVTNVVVYSFYLINSRIEASRVQDLSYVLIQLKNLYLSSRSTDDDLMSIRRSMDKLLKKVHKDISTPLLLATRTAVILYITLRILVKTT